MRKHRFFVLFDAIVALTILVADFCRAVIVTPFVHWPNLRLPSLISVRAPRPLKPEYRESWRSYGLSLARQRLVKIP